MLPSKRRADPPCCAAALVASIGPQTTAFFDGGRHLWLALTFPSAADSFLLGTSHLRRHCGGGGGGGGSAVQCSATAAAAATAVLMLRRCSLCRGSVCRRRCSARRMRVCPSSCRRSRRCLASRLRPLSTGFCFHQPFPSSEIFRCLTNREELLRGMLCADHIGFHLFEWAQNFIACCRR